MATHASAATSSTSARPTGTSRASIRRCWVRNHQLLYSDIINDASFVKLREVSIQYALPSSWAATFRASGATISLAGRNLAHVDEVPGTRPRGIVPGRISRLRSVGTRCHAAVTAVRHDDPSHLLIARHDVTRYSKANTHAEATRAPRAHQSMGVLVDRYGMYGAGVQQLAGRKSTRRDRREHARDSAERRATRQ